MPDAEPAPTMVVGVGQAGIDVISRLQREDGLGWGDQYDEYFDYVVIDSSDNEVRNAPDEATKVHLKAPDKYVGSSQEHYPYLTKELQISKKGAQRQRPVGRFKFDNVDQPSWDAHFNKISDAIERHINNCRNNPDINTRQLNIIHVHSMGGGTGSGTFPLLGQMLNDIIDDLTRRYSTNIYTAGVGVVPEITYDMDLVNPPGDNRYYANTYAALNDLQKMFDASIHDSLPIYIYSKYVRKNPNVDKFVFDRLPEPQSEITHSPYNHYFLLGVDEDQIVGDNKRAGVETYRSAVDNTIVAAIYGMTMYGSQIENWLSEVDSVGDTGFDKFGSFGQTQLSIPIDDIRIYCDLQDRIAGLRKQVDPEDSDEEGDLIEKRKEKINRRDQLQRISDDPETVLEQRENSEDIRDYVNQEVNKKIQRGDVDTGLQTTTADLDNLVEEVRDTYDDDELLAYVMVEAEKRIESEGEDIRKAWREKINSKYKNLEVASEDQFGFAETTAEKAGELRRFLSQKIEELEEEVEELEQEEAESDGSVWPDWLPGGGEDELEQYKEWIEYYRNEKEEFMEWEQKKEKVDSLIRDVRDRRDRFLSETIEPRIQTLKEEIKELKETIEHKRDELKRAIEDREDKIKEITDSEYGERLGYLALDEQKVREDLDRDTLEEDLTSMAAFNEEEYLARELDDRIAGRIEQAFPWQSTLMSWERGADLPFGGGTTSVREIWMLHSEENMELPEFEILDAGDHEFLRVEADPQESPFPSFEDPYTLQFLGYTLDAPIENLKMYAELESAAEDGNLDAMIDEWSDYRLAFGYPEWYGPDIRKVFEIEVSEELPRLPELNIDKVDTDKEKGELKNWISSYGIASYLWNGNDWNDYEGFVSVDGLDSTKKLGWKYTLSEKGLTYSDMRNYVPSGQIAKMWHAGEISWEQLLEEITDNLEKEEGIKVKLVPEK